MVIFTDCLIIGAVSAGTAGTAGAGSVASQASTGVTGAASSAMAVPTGVPFGAAVIGVAGLAVALL